MSNVLMVTVIGTVALALVVDVAAFIGFLRRGGGR